MIITNKIIFHWTSYILIMPPSIYEMTWSPILLMNDRQTWASEVPVQYTGPFVYMIIGEIFYGQVTGVFANITGYCFHLYIQEWYSYKLNSWSRTTFWKLKIKKSYKIKLYIILTIQLVNCVQNYKSNWGVFLPMEVWRVSTELLPLIHSQLLGTSCRFHLVLHLPEQTEPTPVKEIQCTISL